MSKANPKVESGEFRMYYGYVATVLQAFTSHHWAIVEVTDGGGVARQFKVTKLSELLPLTSGEETLLDALQKATRPSYTGQRELQRITEEWMGDPQVGDAFEHPNGLKLEVTELTAAGGVRARRFIDHGPGFGVRAIDEIYDSADVFRAAYQFPKRPGYWLLPLGTRRLDYRENSALYRGVKQPAIPRGSKYAK